MSNTCTKILPLMLLFAIAATPHQLYGLTDGPTDQYLDPQLTQLLDKYHIPSSKSVFTYQYPFEFYAANMPESVPLPDSYVQRSLKEFEYLNNAFFYKDLRLLYNIPKVREYQLKSHPGSSSRGYLLTAQTEDGLTIHGTLLDRGSDTLVVVGAGFTNPREYMAPFGDMLTNYDVLFFDFRGHGDKENATNLKPKTWKSLSKRLLGIEKNRVTFGLNEHLDVHAIVSKVKKMRGYRKTIGLALCYSTMMFTKTEAVFPGTFDKLILDGSWLSLKHAAHTISHDPGLLAKPQRNSWLKDSWLTKSATFRTLLIKFAQRYLNIDFHQISILDFVPQLSSELPILFIHGKNDVFVNPAQFEIIWNATNSQYKAALITPIEHVWNQLKAKEIYKQTAELFIDNEFAEFSRLITEPAVLAAYKEQKYQATFAALS